MKVKSLSRVQLLATPWTAAYQAPPSMGFSRQEYWSGVPLSSPTKTLELLLKGICCCLVTVMSNSLWHDELQHTRLLCPPPSPGAYSNSCPLSPWCHPTILSSVTPFSSCPQSFPSSGSFPMNQFFASRGQSIVSSASASLLPMDIQGWFPLGWTGLISLQSKGLSRVFSSTTFQKHKFFGTQHSL